MEARSDTGAESHRFESRLTIATLAPTAGDSCVLQERQLGLVVEDLIEHVGGVADRGGDDLGAVLRELVRGPGVEWVSQSSDTWDVRTGLLIRTFVGNTATICGLAFTPNGRRLASTSIDETVKLWDVAMGREALLLRGHTSAVFHAAFSPDGTRLAIGDNDCKPKLWDARPWTPEAASEREALGLLGFPLCQASA
jgi:hypothetical protein